MLWDDEQEELEAGRDGWLVETVAIEWRCGSAAAAVMRELSGWHWRTQLQADGAVSESPYGYDPQASGVGRAIQAPQSPLRPDLLTR